MIIITSQFFFSFPILGLQVSFINCLLLSIITDLLLFVNITPGGLGIREILVGLICSFTGISFNVGVLAAGIIRVAAMIVHVGLGVPGLFILRKNDII